MKSGEVYTYSSTFPILSIYPTVRKKRIKMLVSFFPVTMDYHVPFFVVLLQTAVNVEWELVDSKTQQKIICFNIPAKII